MYQYTPTFNVRISPRKMVVYPRYSKLKRPDASARLTKEHAPKGHLSAVSVRKIKKAIELLEAIADEKRSFNPQYSSFWSWKLNFVTLTLPVEKCQVSDANLRRNYLNHFLTLIRRKYHPKGYVWRMEAQANGNVHFHLIFDKWIDKDELRRTWNHVLSKGTFIKEYQKKWQSVSKEEYIQDYLLNIGKRSWKSSLDLSKAREKATKAYEFGQSTEWKQPNTTDIHSTAGITQVTNYLAKYLSKTDGKLLWLKENCSKLKFEPVWSEVRTMLFITPYVYKINRPIEGKLWGCSENLMGEKGITEDFDESDHAIMEGHVERGEVGIYSKERFTIYYQKTLPLRNFMVPLYRTRLDAYILTLRSGQLSIPETISYEYLTKDRPDPPQNPDLPQPEFQQLPCPF